MIMWKMLNINNNREVLLSFKDLKVVYGTKVIHDFLNFELYKGEVISVIGPSGVGKTSFINSLIDSNMRLSEGMILWKGDVFKSEDIASKVGFARQFGSFLSDRTVGANLALPLEFILGIEHDLALELAMLNMLQFDLSEHVFYQYPYALSGGTLKKCMICFATIIGQELVVLDEPLSGLDPIGIEKIRTAVLSLAPKRTLICVTHHYIPSDRYLLFFEGGYIIGTYDELAINPISKDFMMKFANLDPTLKRVGKKLR